MKKKDRILIIGGGRRGLATIEILNEEASIDIMAVVDVNPNASGVKLAERFGIPTDSSWEKYIESDPKPNAVLNLTDNPEIDSKLKMETEGTDIELLGKLTSNLLSGLLMERQVQVELHRVSERITSNIGLDELMVLILSSCVKSTKAEGGLIVLKDEISQQWEIKSDWGLKDEILQELYSYIVNKVSAKSNLDKDLEVLEKKHIIANNSSDSIHTLLATLKTRDNIIGAILVSRSGETEQFSSSSKRLISTFANHSTVAIENTLLYKQTQMLSVTDGLTNLFNHRFFQEKMTSELARAQRYDLNFSIILIDIDNFKDINDTYGHPIGDEVLKKISAYLVSTVRDSDIVARYGGDEFVILLPETTKNGAVIVAERIRKSIAGKQITGDISTHTSLGVASYPDDGVYSKDIVKKADEALYKAKEAGRNKTCAA